MNLAFRSIHKSHLLQFLAGLGPRKAKQVGDCICAGDRRPPPALFAPGLGLTRATSAPGPGLAPFLPGQAAHPKRPFAFRTAATSLRSRFGVAALASAAAEHARQRREGRVAHPARRDDGRMGRQARVTAAAFRAVRPFAARGRTRRHLYRRLALGAGYAGRVAHGRIMNRTGSEFGSLRNVRLDMVRLTGIRTFADSFGSSTKIRTRTSSTTRASTPSTTTRRSILRQTRSTSRTMTTSTLAPKSWSLATASS